MTAPAARRTPRQRQVRARLAVLGALYLTSGALAWALLELRTGTSTSYQSPYYSPMLPRVTTASTSLYATDPGPVTVVLAIVAGAVVVATWSIAWRISHDSRGTGASAMTATVAVGALALLGLLTIGPFLVPVAVLLLLLARPMETLGRESRVRPPVEEP